jgi:hypothetical protein
MFRIRNHLPFGLVLLLVSSGAGAEQDASSVTLDDLYDMLQKQQTATATPADVRTAGEFPGSIRVPGTNMAGKVGGDVRLAIVNNFDPIGLGDQFIAGTIPVPGAASSSDEPLFEGTNISAKRSLLNFDMRMDSSVGLFRAFIEGDFDFCR